MRKSAAIVFLALFSTVTLSVACEDKKPDDLPPQPLRSLAGSKLLVGIPDLSKSSDGVFEKGATRIAVHHPRGNVENWPTYYMTYVELDAPVQQEQIEASIAFGKKHRARMDSAIIMEVLESDLTNPNNPKVKVRLLGAANYPGVSGENFVDTDLKDQPYLPFAVTKQKAAD